MSSKPHIRNERATRDTNPPGYPPGSLPNTWCIAFCGERAVGWFYQSVDHAVLADPGSPEPCDTCLEAIRRRLASDKDEKVRHIAEQLARKNVTPDTIAGYDMLQLAVTTLMITADRSTAKNYIEIVMSGLLPPFDRAAIHLIRPGGKTPMELQRLVEAGLAAMTAARDEACEIADTAASCMTKLYRDEFYRRDGARIAELRKVGAP